MHKTPLSELIDQTIYWELPKWKKIMRPYVTFLNIFSEIAHIWVDLSSKSQGNFHGETFKVIWFKIPPEAKTMQSVKEKIACKDIDQYVIRLSDVKLVFKTWLKTIVNVSKELGTAGHWQVLKYQYHVYMTLRVANATCLFMAKKKGWQVFLFVLYWDSSI